MTLLVWLVLAVGLVLGVAMFSWRTLSRMRALPCPPWLMWLLENPFARRRTYTPMLERLALSPGLHVLDVGCGYGRLSIPIARLVLPRGEVVGADIQEGMLWMARERAQKSGLANLTLRRAGAGEGLLEPGRYDRALMVTVLGEIPRQAEALQEVRNALKPGGFLSVTELLPDPHYQPVGTVRRLAHAAGFGELAYFGNVLGYTLNLERLPGS
ncbi:MAG: class I SAM-dependent methyltransferase [Chloroflexi bacterium]|nr:class I SAM-dependent methyltransferase [Chloroflexota bacterium]